MHRVVSTMTIGSIGDLGRIADRLADNGVNIDAIGGGEALLDGRGVGVIAMLMTPDDDTDRILSALDGLELADGRTLQGATFHPSFDLVLDDHPGELARAARLIGGEGISIMGLVSIDVHAGWGIVGLGFGGEADRDAARDRLREEGFTVLSEHGGQRRRAWVDEMLGDAAPPDEDSMP